MKSRCGFVTNSSSSSFILAFKDHDDRIEFNKWADMLMCNEFLELIKDLEKSEENTNKEEALNRLYLYYIIDFKREFIDERLKDFKYEHWSERIAKEKELIETDEYKKFISEKLKSTDYEEKKKQLEESDSVVMGTIWDTSGGLLEWAIRNGFIEDNFGRNCVICYNVG